MRYAMKFRQLLYLFVEISLGDRCGEASGVAKPRSAPSLLAVLWAILLPVLYTNLKSFSGA